MKGGGVKKNADKSGRKKGRFSACTCLQRSITSKTSENIFNLSVMLAGCRCSLSMVTVDCPIQSTVQCGSRRPLPTLSIEVVRAACWPPP